MRALREKHGKQGKRSQPRKRRVPKPVIRPKQSRVNPGKLDGNVKLDDPVPLKLPTQ